MAFADADAGARHVESAHLKAAMEWMPDYVAGTPQIVHVEIPGATGWSETAELRPRG